MKATVVDGLVVGTGLPSLTVRFSRERLVRYAGASTDFDAMNTSQSFGPRRVLTRWYSSP